MLIEEARWIGRHVDALPARGFPLVNVGSSTGAFRTRQQPWIDQHIFAPARDGGRAVIHVDLKQAEGVDHAGDLLDPAFRASLRELGARSVLCSNLLEHLADRRPVTEALTDLVPPGGYAIVTVPYRYPIHHDPIDTGFRPGVEELAAEFPALRLVAGEVITDVSYWRLVSRDARTLLGSLARLIVPPIYKPRSWLLNATRWAWMVRGRRFQTTCVVLERPA